MTRNRERKMSQQQDHHAARGGHLGAQRGSAFIMAIVILSLLVTAGVALLFLADSDTRMNQANVRDKRTFYIAEAGLEDARERLRAAAAASASPLTFNYELVNAAGPDGVINFNAATLAATYDASGNVTGFTGYGDDRPLSNPNPTSFGGALYAAFLTNDVLDGETNQTDTNQRAMITSIGAGPNRAIKVVQAVVEKLTVPTPPAMITLIGPPATSPATIYDDGSSASKKMTGNDCAGAAGFTGVPGSHVPVVGTFGAAATAQAQASANSGVYTSGVETGSTTVHDVTGTASGLWQDCSYLHDLAQSIRQSADKVCTSASPCNGSYWTSTTNNSVTFVDGDLNLTAGKGLIWVTGTMSVGGNNSFEGMILVIGTGQLTRTGGGSGHSYGAIVVADIAGPDGIFGNVDDCTGGAAGFQPPSYTISGAGNHDHVYCSQAINVSMGRLPARVTQFRQY